MLQSSAMAQSRSLSVRLGFVAVVVAAVGCGAEPAMEPVAAESTPAERPVEAEPPPAARGQDAGPEGVRNYTRVDATVACAGATPPEAMADLKELGFATVINFRTEGERGATVADGRASAEAAGLTYIHLPFREPSAEVTEAFLEAVADPANQPTYIHCGSANRVGAMWLIKRVVQDGYSVEDATAEAEAIGLSSAGLREFALDYVGAGG